MAVLASVISRRGFPLTFGADISGGVTFARPKYRRIGVSTNHKPASDRHNVIAIELLVEMVHAVEEVILRDGPTGTELWSGAEQHTWTVHYLMPFSWKAYAIR